LQESGAPFGALGGCGPFPLAVRYRPLESPSSGAGGVSNAYDDALNQWDNGTVGNHYSNFDCTDADSNGICDSEYSIPGGESQDRYPLANPQNSG